MTMESLLPSEVARLVYGYLLEENCIEAAEKFLETSPHLKECLYVSRKGKKFQTRFEGRNLLAILDILTQVKTQAQIVAEELPQNSLLNKKLLDLLALLSIEVSPCLESEDEVSELHNSESSDKTAVQLSPEVVTNENVDHTNCSSPSSEKSVSLKRDNGHLNEGTTNTEPSPSSSSQIPEVVTIDDQTDALPGEDSDMEITECSSKDHGESALNRARIESASLKRIKLVDVTNSDDDIIECITPDVDIIDLDAEDSNNSSQSSTSVDNYRMNSAGQNANKSHAERKKRRNKKKNKTRKNRASGSGSVEAGSSRVEVVSGAQGSSGSAVPNDVPQVSPNSGNPGAAPPSAASVPNNAVLLTAPYPFQGRPVLKAPHIAMYNPSYVRGAPLRFISRLPRHPVVTPRWMGDTLPKPGPSRPPLPVVVNRQVIQTSSFGLVGPSGRASAPDSNFHVVTEKVVMQMMASRAGEQPRISQSVLTNQALIRPAHISVLPREPYM